MNISECKSSKLVGFLDVSHYWKRSLVQRKSGVKYIRYRSTGLQLTELSFGRTVRAEEINGLKVGLCDMLRVIIKCLIVYHLEEKIT